MHFQPMAPTQVFGAGAVTVLLEQGVTHQVRRRLEGLGREQRRAGHRRHHFVEQGHRRWRSIVGVAVTKTQVDLGIFRVGPAVVRRNTDIDVGMLALEIGQPRQQPQRRKGREGGHSDLPPIAHGTDLAHADVQLLEQRRHRAQQRTARPGELDVACAAQEQCRAEFAFQRTDLSADGGLGQVQLFGGSAEAQAPPHRFEGAQAAQRERPVARHIHINSASMPAANIIGLYRCHLP